MVTVVKETIHENNSRIWGEFKLSDGSTTQFEMSRADIKSLGEGAWFQWGNTTDKLWLTVKRVEDLTRNWAERKLGKVL